MIKNKVDICISIRLNMALIELISITKGLSLLFFTNNLNDTNIC